MTRGFKFAIQVSLNCNRIWKTYSTVPVRKFCFSIRNPFIQQTEYQLDIHSLASIALRALWCA